ncbi:MAG: UDP-glucuronic acid decarboxylase family protein [Pyrinomonadaceae bacterium]
MSAQKDTDSRNTNGRSDHRPVTLVSGGAGFVGSHLCDRLLKDDHRVVCIDNFSTGRKKNIQHLLTNDRFSLIRRDVTKYVDFDGPLDYIYHLASPASPPDYLELPIQTLKVGALGTHNLLGLAHVKQARFLLASTSEVYGDPHVHPQVETYWGNVNPVGVRGVYDEAKRYAEALTMAYHRQHGIQTHIVRIFNTYGPRMRAEDGRVVSNFITQAITGKALTIYGDGLQTRSFQYVDDLVEGMIRLSESDYLEPVNIGNPEEYTMIQLAQIIKELVGSQPEIIYVPLPTDDPKQRRPDITLAKKILSWEPQIPVREGLKRTIEYFYQELGLRGKVA